MHYNTFFVLKAVYFLRFKLTLHWHVAIIKVMFLNHSIEAIKEGLAAASIRHNLIVENISNVSTPRYQRKDLDFNKAFRMRMNETIAAQRTHEKHFSFSGQTADWDLFVTKPNVTDVNSNFNNVDLDVELVNMSNNTIYYNALSVLAQKKFNIYRSVLREKIA